MFSIYRSAHIFCFSFLHYRKHVHSLSISFWYKIPSVKYHRAGLHVIFIWLHLFECGNLYQRNTMGCYLIPTLHFPMKPNLRIARSQWNIDKRVFINGEIKILIILLDMLLFVLLLENSIGSGSTLRRDA